MQEIRFATKEEAEARSRSEWEKVLGRRRRSSDVTEFLWQPVVTEDGTALLRVPDADAARLSIKERSVLRTATASTEPLDEALTREG